jgi:hypothetical protein
MSNDYAKSPTPQQQRCPASVESDRNHLDLNSA